MCQKWHFWTVWIRQNWISQKFWVAVKWSISTKSSLNFTFWKFLEHSANISFFTYYVVLTYLSWWEYGDVVFVDYPSFFFYHFRTAFFLEIFTCKPEENILFTVFTAEKRSKCFPTACKIGKRSNLIVLHDEIKSYFKWELVALSC